MLARLKPEEGAGVLRSLLERHPELVAEAEEIAKATVTDVDADAVAEDVERAVLDLDIDDLGTRAGRKSWGYVEPTEAACELLGEAVDPFIEEMKRHIELGFEAAATGTCAGIVLGLYRCRGQELRSILGWAEDFPEETAGHAVATLARESAAKHRRALPREIMSSSKPVFSVEPSDSLRFRRPPYTEGPLLPRRAGPERASPVDAFPVPACRP